jgi:hypothetical protein
MVVNLMTLSRVETQSAPESNDGCECNCWHEIDRQLGVAGGHAANTFQATKVSLRLLFVKKAVS